MLTLNHHGMIEWLYYTATACWFIWFILCNNNHNTACISNQQFKRSLLYHPKFIKRNFQPVIDNHYLSKQIRKSIYHVSSYYDSNNHIKLDEEIYLTRSFEILPCCSLVRLWVVWGPGRVYVFISATFVVVFVWQGESFSFSRVCKWLCEWV